MNYLFKGMSCWTPPIHFVEFPARIRLSEACCAWITSDPRLREKDTLGQMSCHFELIDPQSPRKLVEQEALVKQLTHSHDLCGPPFSDLSLRKPVDEGLASDFTRSRDNDRTGNGHVVWPKRRWH